MKKPPKPSKPAPAKRPRGRPAGLLLKLTAAQYLRLVYGLRSETGPVNLAATARAFGITRATLHRYIKAEPGLQEVVDARRAEAGRGYVPVKRGTRKTRRAAKTKLAQQRVLPRPQRPDPIPPAPMMEALDAWNRREEEWRRKFEGDASPAEIEELSAKVSATLKRPPVPPDVEARRAAQSKTRAGFKVARNGKVATPVVPVNPPPMPQRGSLPTDGNATYLGYTPGEVFGRRLAPEEWEEVKRERKLQRYPKK